MKPTFEQAALLNFNVNEFTQSVIVGAALNLHSP